MKYLLLPIGLLFAFFLTTAFISPSTETVKYEVFSSPSGDDIPADVMAVLEKSCLPCHGADGSGKAKMKWNYEKMEELDVSRKISKLAKIADEVSESKMPPNKFVKKYPESVPSNEERALVASWAEKAAENLLGSGN